MSLCPIASRGKRARLRNTATFSVKAIESQAGTRCRTKRGAQTGPTKQLPRRYSITPICRPPTIPGRAAPKHVFGAEIYFLCVKRTSMPRRPAQSEADTSVLAILPRRANTKGPRARLPQTDAGADPLLREHDARQATAMRYIVLWRSMIA